MDYNKTLGYMPFLWNDMHPDRVAIIHKEKEYTYRDLHDISLSFAAYFATSGVKRGDHVLLWARIRRTGSSLFSVCKCSVPLPCR